MPDLGMSIWKLLGGRDRTYLDTVTISLPRLVEAPFRARPAGVNYRHRARKGAPPVAVPECARRDRRARRGFTLIELLIVIAIVTMLAALLLPSLISARESGRRAACQGNLRQIGIAMVSYAGDFAGNFPRVCSDSTSGLKNQCSWSFVLAKATMNINLRSPLPVANMYFYNSGQQPVRTPFVCPTVAAQLWTRGNRLTSEWSGGTYAGNIGWCLDPRTPDYTGGSNPLWFDRINRADFPLVMDAGYECAFPIYGGAQYNIQLTYSDRCGDFYHGANFYSGGTIDRSFPGFFHAPGPNYPLMGAVNQLNIDCSVISINASRVPRYSSNSQYNTTIPYFANTSTPQPLP